MTISDEIEEARRVIAEERAGLNGGGGESDQETAIKIQPWPDPPSPAVYHGLAGDIVRAIEPHSEADPLALLIQFLAAFGNAAGRSSHFVAEADRHGLNLFTCLVGATAKGRKGTSWGHIRRLFSQVDEVWTGKRVLSGLSSGEGLVWAVRDTNDKDEGEGDKRLLAIEQEMASVLRVLAREGNTLSAMIRQAWDAGNLRTLTKNSRAVATDAHISIIGHITRDELVRHLGTTEVGNGFANRFLWLCVRRSKILPEGGRIEDRNLNPLVVRLHEALKVARTMGELRRDGEARALWFTVYADLSEGKPGLLGAVTSRAEAQVMRLAAIYATLDLSSQIRRVHLEAAVALWEYCDASARFIFGEALGDPVADTILTRLKAASEAGLSRTEIRDLFDRHRSKADIDRALLALSAAELIEKQDLPENTKGRPVERWLTKKLDATKAM